MDEDGWITWTGDECPVAFETLVNWRTHESIMEPNSDELDLISREAGKLIWDRWNDSSEIIAYRVVQP